MGWYGRTGSQEWHNSDYRGFFDHTIICDDLIISFPYSFDESRVSGFRSFCKMYGHNVHFYDAPSSYFDRTMTVVIHPKGYDDCNLQKSYTELMKNHVIKALDKRYPTNRPHNFVIGKEILINS